MPGSVAPPYRPASHLRPKSQLCSYSWTLLILIGTPGAGETPRYSLAFVSRRQSAVRINYWLRHNGFGSTPPSEERHRGMDITRIQAATVTGVSNPSGGRKPPERNLRKLTPPAPRFLKLLLRSRPGQS